MLDAPVCVPIGDEGGGASCEDGLDNDCDGFTDGADSDCPRVRFRSVGVNARALVTTTVEIAGDVATFAAPVPSSVGVGDVVVVMGGAFLPPPAFVSERLGPATFRVQAADGGPPGAATPGSEVQIYRAYTSLAAWQALDEDPGLPAGARDFDRDRMLVDARSTLQVALYADGDDHGGNVEISFPASATHIAGLEVIAINNIAFALTGPAFFEFNGTGEYGAGSTHDVSGDVSAAWLGTPSVVGADPAALFVGIDPAAPDLHLRAGAPILGTGPDVSADPRFAVTDDIDGQPRPPGAVDPGADQRSP